MISIIVVTHNSESYIDKLLENMPKEYELIIVDSGSLSRNYLDVAQQKHKFKLITLENVGFAKANNIGYSYLSPNAQYVAFINPDLFLSSGWLEYASNLMSQPEYADVAVFSSALERYDIKASRALGVYDSLGIAKHRFWYDIGQGDPVACDSHSKSIMERDAICGALMFCRRTALDDVSKNGEVFWEKLYMYKEDIELSLRLRRAGYKLCIDLTTINYHCRGWKDRKFVPKWAKLISARNDILVSMKYDVKSVPLFLLKYLYVRFIER